MCKLLDYQQSLLTSLDLLYLKNGAYHLKLSQSFPVRAKNSSKHTLNLDKILFDTQKYNPPITEYKVDSNILATLY